MEQTELFNQIRTDLQTRIHFLEDKPEETLESTLKALWLKAAGLSVSAEKALDLTLPSLTESQVEDLQQLIKQRLNNVPLAHITQRQSFMGLELKSDKRALIPRKETEILGKKALELSKIIAQSKDAVRVFDICCGAGNLGIAVANYNPKCTVYSSDLSQDAVDLTGENIHLMQLDHRIQVKQGDLMSAFEEVENYEQIDLIICNPPYILSSKVQKMDAEIASNEPVLAFDGGMLGIKIIQKLIREAPKFLTSNGWLVFELGAGQGEFIFQVVERTELYQNIESVADQNGVIRVIAAQKKVISNQ
jgi:release factor glutamine methyltransferase